MRPSERLFRFLRRGHWSRIGRNGSIRGFGVSYRGLSHPEVLANGVPNHATIPRSVRESRSGTPDSLNVSGHPDRVAVVIDSAWLDLVVPVRSTHQVGNTGGRVGKYFRTRRRIP